MDAPATAPATDSDPRDLHGIAVDIQTDLQKLATGLAHAGAAPNAVQQLTKMAEIVSEVVKALGQAPAPGGAPSPGAAPQGPPQPQQAPAQPQAPQATPPQGAAHQTLHAATHALHAAMIASKQARQGP